MKLLTKKLIEDMPEIGSGDKCGDGDDAKIVCKFFTPWTNWTWYVLEGGPVFDEDTGEQTDYLFFGMVHGLEHELGYFSLSELEGLRGPVGLKIERDLYWKPITLGELKAEGVTV